MPLPPRPEPRGRRPARAAGLVLLLAGALWAGRADLASHRDRWFGGARAQIALDPAALAPGMDEAALAGLLGAPLRCHDVPGGRVCDAAIAQAGGVPAARLRATWAQGRLQSSETFLPWWAHHQAARALTARLGAPQRFSTQVAPDAPPATLMWDRSNGTIGIARAPGWNPWRWTVLRWDAAPAERPPA